MIEQRGLTATSSSIRVPYCPKNKYEQKQYDDDDNDVTNRFGTLLSFDKLSKLHSQGYISLLLTLSSMWLPSLRSCCLLESWFGAILLALSHKVNEMEEGLEKTKMC